MASLLDFFRNIPGFLLNGLTDEVMVPGADPDNIQFPFDNQRKQRVPSKFANVLGEALRRGAVAASTPSIAGGGGFDILRSMVAADDDSMKRQQFGQSMQNGQLDRMLRMQQLQNEALWRQSQMENFRQQSEDRDLERERKAKEDEQTALINQQKEQSAFGERGGFFLNNAQAPRDYNIPVAPWMLIPKDQATKAPSATYDPKGSVRMQQTPGFLAGEKQREKEKAERESWMVFPADVPEAQVKKGDKVPAQVYGQLLQFLRPKTEGNPTEASLALRAAMGDEAAAKALKNLPRMVIAESNRGDKNSLRDRRDEFALRREYNSLPIVKDFNDLRQSISKIDSAYQQALKNTRDQKSKAAADQTIITAFNKMLDPQSVVREGEYARTTQGQSVLNQLRGKIEAAINGGTGLTDADREQIVAVSRILLKDLSSMYDEARGRYSGLADEYGFSPDRVVGKRPNLEFLNNNSEKPNQGNQPPISREEVERLRRQLRGNK